MWSFCVVEGSLVAGRGTIKEKFNIDQVDTVTVQAVYSDDNRIRTVTIPAVPRFLFNAFHILHKNELRYPGLGEEDGTFRMVGNVDRQKQFWEDDKAIQEGLFDYYDRLTTTDIGTLIMHFLRELKNPLVTVGSYLYNNLLAEMKKMMPILEIDLERYPQAGTLLFVAANLNKIASTTNMKTENLALLFSTTIVRAANCKYNVGNSQIPSQLCEVVAICKFLIEISHKTIIYSNGSCM